ncbi:MAG: helix-hairpin-helix domain-containing protein [Planctomycetes bacterium]|nr:helix-hairpin-helix domain-containing protein [Planctomycetota bacterium]
MSEDADFWYGQAQPDGILRLLRLRATAEVLFFESIGRAIVVIKPVASANHPSAAEIRAASRKSGWDVEVMTADGFAHLKQRALSQFGLLHDVTTALANALIDQGYFSCDDLAVIERELLARLGNFDNAVAESIIEQAEDIAEMS